MHWGHQVTKDMIKWEQIPAALAPDTEYDEDGCFSGTAIEDKGRHILIYTSVMKNHDGEGVLQNQSIAVGDRTEYTKIGCNPVVNGDMLPYGLSIEDFGGVWECPDFFAIDGHKVLLVSPIENDDKESCQKVLTTFLVICYTPLYRKMTTIVVIWHM